MNTTLGLAATEYCTHPDAVFAVMTVTSSHKLVFVEPVFSLTKNTHSTIFSSIYSMCHLADQKEL